MPLTNKSWRNWRMMTCKGGHLMASPGPPDSNCDGMLYMASLWWTLTVVCVSSPPSVTKSYPHCDGLLSVSIMIGISYCLNNPSGDDTLVKSHASYSACKFSQCVMSPHPPLENQIVSGMWEWEQIIYTHPIHTCLCSFEKIHPQTMYVYLNKSWEGLFCLAGIWDAFCEIPPWCSMEASTTP